MFLMLNLLKAVRQGVTALLFFVCLGHETKASLTEEFTAEASQVTLQEMFQALDYLEDALGRSPLVRAVTHHVVQENLLYPSLLMCVKKVFIPEEPLVFGASCVVGGAIGLFYYYTHSPGEDE